MVNRGDNVLGYVILFEFSALTVHKIRQLVVYHSLNSDLGLITNRFSGNLRNLFWLSFVEKGFYLLYLLTETIHQFTISTLKESPLTGQTGKNINFVTSFPLHYRRNSPS